MIYFAIFWASCSIIHHGLNFAYWMNAWPDISEYKEEIIRSIWISLFGPLAIIAHIAFMGRKIFKYGFKLW